MTRWRHLFISAQIQGRDPERFLDRYGADGWEVVSVRMYVDVDGMPYIEAFFKQPIEEGKKRKS